MALAESVRALVRPAVADLDPYDPAFVACEVNLSANECTWPVDPATARAVADAVASAALERYPDPLANALRDELAAWHGVSRPNIIVGNGGDELIYNLFVAFGGPGRRLLDMPPTFSVYRIYASMLDTEVLAVPRDPETFEPDWDEVLAVAPKCSIAIVTSPNNPTGNVESLGRIEELCEACPGIVMVDEAYGEFAPEVPTAASLIDRHPNLVVLHTLSKAFGLAGARVGYLVADPSVIDVFAAVRQPYTVNVMSQAAALASVERRAAALERVAAIVAERERLAAAIDDLGIRHWPSQGNFILLRVPDAAEVRRRLAEEHSVLVRDLSSEEGLEDCLRVSVGTPAEDDRVIEAFRSVLNG